MRAADETPTPTDDDDERCARYPEHLCVARVVGPDGRRPGGLCVYGCAIDNGHSPPAARKG